MALTKTKTKFAVCLKNKGYEHSLLTGKLYEILPDKIAKGRGTIRVIDEEGEDYLYPEDMFYTLALPNDVASYLHTQAV